MKEWMAVNDGMMLEEGCGGWMILGEREAAGGFCLVQWVPLSEL